MLDKLKLTCYNYKLHYNADTVQKSIGRDLFRYNIIRRFSTKNDKNVAILCGRTDFEGLSCGMGLKNVL